MNKILVVCAKNDIIRNELKKAKRIHELATVLTDNTDEIDAALAEAMLEYSNALRRSVDEISGLSLDLWSICNEILREEKKAQEDKAADAPEPIAYPVTKEELRNG